MRKLLIVVLALTNIYTAYELIQTRQDLKEAQRQVALWEVVGEETTELARDIREIVEDEEQQKKAEETNNE